VQFAALPALSVSCISVMYRVPTSRKCSPHSPQDSKMVFILKNLSSWMQMSLKVDEFYTKCIRRKLIGVPYIAALLVLLLRILPLRVHFGFVTIDHSSK